MQGMEMLEVLKSVQFSGVECIVPVLPGVGNLEDLLQEATKRNLRLAGVPARCITILPPLPCTEDDLLTFARCYCFSDGMGASKGEIRKMLFDVLDDCVPLNANIAYHPVDVLMRILHLLLALSRASDLDFRLLSQSLALLQLAEVSRVAQVLRHDVATGLSEATRANAERVLREGQPKAIAHETFHQEQLPKKEMSDDEIDGTEHVDDGAEQMTPARFLKEIDFEIVNKSGIFFEDPSNEKGPLAAIYLKGALSSHLCGSASAVLEHAATTRNLRKMLNGGTPPHTGIVGFYDYVNNASSRKCRETQFTRRNWPEIANDVTPLLQRLDAIYREYAPLHYKQQKSSIPERFQLFGTAFSTLTVNRNFRTAAHADRGDFKSGLGIVAVLDGEYEGCHLAIPAINRAFDLKPGDVLLFNTSLEHGNTEVHSPADMWTRLSIVAYFRTGLVSQACIEQEERQMRELILNDPRPKHDVVNLNMANKFQTGPLMMPRTLLPLLSQAQMSAIIFASERLHRNSGSILGMSMGLGKTLVALSLIFSHSFQNRQDDLLVITPKTIVPHWLEEIEKWRRVACLHLSLSVVSSELQQVDFENAVLQYQHQCEGESHKVGHCFIVNPEAVGPLMRRCQKLNPALIILDEGHRVSSKQSRLKEFLAQFSSRRRVVLSGTPVQNHSEELFRLVEWVAPEVVLTLSKESFCELATHIDAFVDSNANASDSLFKCAARAQRFILDWQKGFVLRCVDLQLPELTDLLVVCGSSGWQKHQRIIFNLERCSSSLQACEHRTHHLSAHPLCLIGFIAGIWSRSNEQIEFLPQDEKNRCDELLQNRQQKEFVEDIASLSGKMQALINIVAYCQRRREKVVVFSQYVGVQELIYRFLIAGGFNPLLLRGRDSLDMRKKSIKRFASLQSDQCSALIVSTRVGAYGVDLTTANNVVLFDSWWNPQVDAQAIARCYRRNQVRQVCVFRLATFFDDASVIRSQYRKLALVESLIDGNLSRPKLPQLFAGDDTPAGIIQDASKDREELWTTLIKQRLNDDAQSGLAGDSSIVAVLQHCGS
ncbi:SNF2 DNA repair protein, putative [Bodo saltans]|uniref:Bifunctional helicase and thymine dioxygenase JBP2 n=1 Tax=Bodo saltans TaxID=75058 RepID=A0A0S4IUR7_BODSA|nr:SNF2 DNA repair protein, putative [Bodo saltans]|eukprot:CUF37679.1 SNF2 DNA repair protein, putative [Bodo saltans]